MFLTIFVRRTKYEKRLFSSNKEQRSRNTAITRAILFLEKLFNVNQGVLSINGVITSF